MLNELKEENNKTMTENYARSYKSTKNHLLDFFALGGALRSRMEEDIISLFSKAFDEDSKYALKCLFYFRDIRGGQGERRTFRVILQHLADKHPERLKPLVKHIPEYGRWDDLFVLLDTKVDDEVMSVITEQLQKDESSERPSLLGKWMKSENTSSKESREIAKKLRKKIGFSSKEYRNLLVNLRKKIDIVESKMSMNRWKEIKYQNVPSRAAMIYRNAFERHDPEGYRQFIEDVKSGKKTIKSGTLYPYDIVDKILNKRQWDETLEEQWKALPNYADSDLNGIVVADTSGSMDCPFSTPLPLSVSVSLALYFAEHNKGPFANHFITFSQKPELQKVVGKNLFEKVVNLSKADWGYNTDIEKVFQLILSTALKHNLSQEKLPKHIIFVSDMEFDRATRNPDESIFHNAKQSFEEAGYQLPEIVFWNVNARNTHVPVTYDERGVQLISGMSPVAFKHIVSGKTAYELMIDLLSSERYAPIE